MLQLRIVLSVSLTLSAFSGDVVTQECVDKLIRTSDMLCPITGKTLRGKDLIHLQRVYNHARVYQVWYFLVIPPGRNRICREWS